MEKISLLRKLLRLAAALAVLGVITAAIGTWALKRYLPPEKLRELVLSQAGKALQREVRLDRVSVGLVQGLVIERLAISERPDFKAGSFAEADSFALRLRLLPLLHKKIEVDKVSAAGLKLNIARRPDGTFNFSDLAGSTAAVSAPAPGAGLALSVSKASLRGAQVVYKDPAAGQDIKVSGLDAKIAHFSLDGPFSADIELDAAGRLGPRPLAASLAFSGKLDLGGGRLERMSAQVRNLKVAQSGRELRLSGNISDGQAPKLDIAAEVSLSGKEILSAAVSGVLTSIGPAASGDINVKLRTPGFDPAALRLAAALPAGLPPGLVVPQAQAEARLRLAGDELRFDGLKVEAKMLRLAAAGRLRKIYSGKPEPELQADVHLELPKLQAAVAAWAKLPPGVSIPASVVDARLQLKPWTATFESLRVSNAALRLEASGAVTDLLAARPRPQELDIKVHLDLPQLAAADAPWLKLPIGLIVPAASVDAQARLRAWDADISRLRAEVPGAQIEASGAVRDLLGKPKPEGIKAKVHLDTARLPAATWAWLKLPAGLSVPPFALDTDLRLAGDDVLVDALRLKAAAGEVRAKGALRKALAGTPDPELDVQGKLDLPAFKSADVPLSGVPPGLVVPPAQLEFSALGGLDNVEVRRLRVVLGRNDLEASGKVKAARSADPGLDILLKCRSFALAELTPIAPQTRDLKLAGSGLFALGLTGPVSKLLLSGKMKFSGLGASVSGLELADFSGTATFDERRIDIPNLTGKVADGSLRMDFTLKNYRQTPLIDLEASLDRFDLGKYLAAKTALAANKPAGPAPAAGRAKPAAPFAAQGRFTVGELVHPNVTAKDVRLNWQLQGITPDLKSLDGAAKLLVSGGKFNDIGKMAAQSVVVKVLTLPLMLIQKIGGIGGIRIFPDFNNIAFSEIAGDYAFDQGRMTLKDSHLYSDAAQVSAGGTIDLPSEKLDVLVTAQVANVAPMDIKVGGTFEKPVTKVQLGKFLTDPAKNLIKNIFQRPGEAKPEPEQP